MLYVYMNIHFLLFLNVLKTTMYSKIRKFTIKVLLNNTLMNNKPLQHSLTDINHHSDV